MKFTRSLLVLSLLAIVLVPEAEAQRRRRSVGFRPPAPPVSGQCHTFGFVKPGLSATYLSRTAGGDATFTINYISDTATETRTTQTVTTAQGTADAETTITGEIVGNLRAIKHIFIRTSMTVPVIGKLTTDIDIDFVPSLAAGPAQGWCLGATWITAPSIQTIVSRPSIGPPITITNNLIGSEGVVLAVDEVVTVPAGTFRTVKYKGAIVSGNNVSYAITWMSKEHNIAVKQDTIDEAGNVTTVTELTKM